MKRSKPDPILDERLGLRPPEVVRILGSEQIFHEVCEVGVRPQLDVAKCNDRKMLSI
jgi:hypothetical protein